jgi:hypothetical protein
MDQPEEEHGNTFDGKALALVVEQATAEREREVKLFLNYEREAVNISGECGAASDALVCAAVGKANGKPKRQTRLKGDERRTGKKMLDPTRIVSSRDGSACHERLDENVVIIKGGMRNPDHLHMLERWPEEFTFEQPYSRFVERRCESILRVLTVASTRKLHRMQAALQTGRIWIWRF